MPTSPTQPAADPGRADYGQGPLTPAQQRAAIKAKLIEKLPARVDANGRPVRPEGK